MHSWFTNDLRKIFIGILLVCCVTNAHAQKQKVWVDADTGNETDDLYALVRILCDTKVEVAGISSAHFNNADMVALKNWNQYNTNKINTVNISQQLNERLLQSMGKLSILHPIGANQQMGRAWGGKEPRYSPAANQIIATVKKLQKNEKLIVICLGALTNIASAIAIDTSIVKHLTCYLLGAQYDINARYWNKNEFNIRNDLNAFDYLLDNRSVDLVVMPITTAKNFKFKRDSLFAILNESSPVKKMLKNRWKETNPNDLERTLWDLALVEAYLNPISTVMNEVLTPPENTRRMIKLYSLIDDDKLKRDFIEKLNTLSN